PHVETDGYGKPIVLFKDNSKGFKDERAWRGLVMDNALEGVARDIFADALMRLEAAGYPVVLHVHDEIVCELPIGTGTLEEFQQLMIDVPSWAQGLPIEAEPRESQRFIKIKPPKIEAPAAAAPIPARQSDANSTPEPEIIQSFRQEPAEGGASLHPSAAPVKEIPMQENVVAFPPKRHSSDGNVHGASRPPRGRRTAQFFYPHLDRSEYLRVDRYDGAEREFHQSHWDGKQWASGVKGTYAERKIPYRLPELKAALQANPDVQ